MATSILPTIIEIQREEDIIVARQRGREMARELGFGAVDQSRIATAISELARNIVRYADHGTVMIRPVDRGLQQGIEVVCEDQGPGIPDPEVALTEGVSTGGGLGIGLPGTRRLMDEMELESEPARGTKVVIRKWLR